MRNLALMLMTAAVLLACAAVPPPAPAPAAPQTALDEAVAGLMAQARVTGLSLALIRDAQVVELKSYGLADAGSGRALQTDALMYGASLTKPAFAHLVLQLVDEGLFGLDQPIAELLPRPLPELPEFADLAADPRWQRLTLRMLLSHSSGLLNWRWINDDKKLDFKFEPGSRYVYSGEGLQIAQAVVEARSGEPLAALMQRRVFDRFGMVDSSMVWRDELAPRAAMGHRKDGTVLGHRRFGRARAAGSMHTSLPDYARFLAAVLRGEGLSAASQQQMLGAQIAIVSPQQFPSHFGGETEVNRPIDLAAGLGWIRYRSPRGPVFFKEGNDEGTNNFAIGFPAQRDGLLLLANSANADQIFYALVERLFAPSCLPWFWMGYVPHDRAELRSNTARQTPLGPDAACLRALGSALPAERK